MTLTPVQLPWSAPADEMTFSDTQEHHYADVVEALLHDYEARLPLRTISDVVGQCRKDLAGSPKQAIPELLDRLARYRLSGLTTTSAASTPASALGQEKQAPAVTLSGLHGSWGGE
jgi:hypothetical protein